MEPHDAPPPPYAEIDQNDIHDDTSSSWSNIVYTPPDTPLDSRHNLNVGADDYHTSPSTQAYFDSHPTLRQAPSRSLVISLAINQNAAFEDFPYPTWAADRETTEQDWQTFVNHLLPDHAAKTNSHLIDRKLHDESDTQSSETKRSISEAQLDQLRSSSGASDGLHDVNATIREWNDGFFMPRGITIRRIPPPRAVQVQDTQDEAQDETGERKPLHSEPRIPGAWDDAGEQSSPPSEPRPQPESQGPSRGRLNPLNFVGSDGIQIGPLRVNGDRVSIGDTFQVDRNGVRWNGQAPGRDSFEPDSRGMRWHSHTFPGSTEQPGTSNHQGHRNGQDDVSSSGSSVSSSSSSSDSGSSIGSLPDWDDLKDTQLPVTKQSITTWLAHPEQPVTKHMVNRAKVDIAAARALPDVDDQSSGTTKKALRQEVRVLLQQFNHLKKQQKSSSKAARREKKTQRKAFRRERKARRSAERRERRSQRQRFRRDEHQDGQNRNQRYHGHGPHRAFAGMPGSFPTGFGAAAGPPHIPSVPPVPSPPPPPPPPPPPMHPTGPNAFFGSGFFGGSGGPFGRRGRGGCPARGSGSGWQQQVQQATQHAAEVAAASQEQAQRAVAAAMRQAAQAQESAMRQAAEAREHGMRQAAEAREHGMRQAAQAHERGMREAAAATQSSMHAAFGGNNNNTAGRPGRPGRPGRSCRRAEPTQPRQPAGTTASSNNNSNSNSKYETVGRLEAQISAKVESLWELRENAGPGGPSSKEASEAAAGLEKELEEMSRDVERLRLEADEEYARQLEAEERKGGMSFI